MPTATESERYVVALGDELLRSITLPLDVALETLRQPITPMLDPAEYADTVDKQRFERNLPNFFREVSRKLGEAQQMAIAQQDAMSTEYAARDIADNVALSNPPGGARFVPNETGQPSDASAQIDPGVIDALSETLQAEQSGDSAVPPTAGGVVTYQDKPYTLDTENKRLINQADPNDVVPIEIKDGEILIRSRGPELSAPSVSGSKVGRFLGGVKDVATDVLAPVGHAAEAGIEGIGEGITRIPLPGAEKVGMAVGALPEAAAEFKKTFGEEFEKKTGQPLGYETALAAINKYGLRDTADRLARTTDKVLTDYTIDPILHATLPEWAADPLVKAAGVGASMLPYLAISIANPAAGYALGSTFALSATEDIKNLTAEYQRGNIDGKTFMLGVGLDLLDIVPEVAGPLVRSAKRGFSSRRALAEAMDQVEGAKVASVGKTPEQIAGLTSDAEAARAVEAKTVEAPVEQATAAPEGAVAGERVVPAEKTPTAQLEAVPSAAAVPAKADIEQPAPTVRETGQVAAAVSAQSIEEAPRSPLDARMGRHRLTTADGDRLDWRETPEGAHIADVTVQQEGRGTGTAMLDRAIADARATNPEAVITGDLNSESGARLFARQAGAEFTDIRGNALTPDGAIAAAVRGEGPQVSLRPAAAARAVEAAPAPAAIAAPVATARPKVRDLRGRTEKMRERGPRRRRYPVATLPPEIATPTPAAVAAQSARSADLRVSRELDNAAKGEAGISAKGDMEAGQAIASPEALRVRDSYRQQITHRSTSDLQRRIDDSATPAWQKRESVLEVERRTTRAEARREQWKSMSTYQQRLARAQGYDTEPPLPAPKVHQVSQAMSELSPKMTVPEMAAWLRRNADIVGDPDRYLDKGSAYWVKSRKGKVLDLGRVLADVRNRVAVTSGVDARAQGVDTPMLDALRIKTKAFADGTLGICRI